MHDAAPRADPLRGHDLVPPDRRRECGGGSGSIAVTRFPEQQCRPALEAGQRGWIEARFYPRKSGETLSTLQQLDQFFM